MSGYDNIIVSYYCIVGIKYSVKWVDCNNVVNYFIKKNYESGLCSPDFYKDACHAV